MASSIPLPSSLAVNRATASRSENRKGRSNNRYFRVKDSNFEREGAASCTSPRSRASITLLSSNRVELGNTSIQAVPSISALMRAARSVAASPLGCPTAETTWLNLMTISPSSHPSGPASAAGVDNRAMPAAAARAGINLIKLSSLLHASSRCITKRENSLW